MELRPWWLLLLLETIGMYAVTDAAPDNSTSHFRHGRHVCVHHRQMAQPIPVRQSYIRPMYRQTMGMCDNYRICPRYSLAYTVAFRTIFHVRISTKSVHDCCPGWGRKSKRDKDCMKPVCQGGCFNGGQCTAPHTCECSEGWTGKSCDQDINECAAPNNCQQVCHNLPGRYECGCHDGFDLLPDKVTCKLCISCMSEYKEMKKTISSLMVKVKNLEDEKNFLMGNVSYLADHYHEAMVTMHELKSATRPPPTTTTPDPIRFHPAYDKRGSIPLDRIASLSEQISLLEERLEGCTCRNNGKRRGRGNY
ncbi:epidermal growth factor-like protein 7 [Haliotis asinina]|uniref:epidermal growth factor-like protein 7 n=1 Tax=Haliotis asinina TaxID=109174 RepID=UPI003532105C